MIGIFFKSLTDAWYFGSQFTDIDGFYQRRFALVKEQALI